MDAVTVRRDVPYRTTSAGILTMDLYLPPDSPSGLGRPGVIFVSGYSDVGMEAIVGSKLKEWESYIGWGKLTAASGLVLVGITYSATEPAGDVAAVVQHIRHNADSLGIDQSRIALWACSGNVPLALSLLIEQAAFRCAVFCYGYTCYGYTLDLDASTGVREAARTYGFANPSAGRSVADLPPETPLFVVRAGLDQLPHLNQTMDQFLAQALARNLPITFVNHPTGPHAFDLFDDSETTREIVRQILSFLSVHLSRQR
jgi:acetyl esterase/lipase